MLLNVGDQYRTWLQLYTATRGSESHHTIEATADISRWMIHENLPAGLTPFWVFQSMRQSSITDVSFQQAAN